MFNQGFYRNGIGETEANHTNNPYYHQQRQNARKIALAYKRKEEQAKQQNDTAA